MAEKTIEDVLQRLDKLEKPKKKDFWDKLSTIGVPALLTVVVSAVGLFQSHKLNEQKNEITNLKAQLEFQVDSDGVKIKQAETIKQYFDDLIHQDEIRRKIAMEAVRIILPAESSARIFRVLEQRGNEQERKDATLASNNLRKSNIASLYSDSAAERKSAYNALIQSWSNDDDLVDEVIAQYDEFKDARGRLVSENGFENGLYNSLVLLSHLKPVVLKRKATTIREFADGLNNIGPKTEGRKKTLLDRVSRAS